MQPGIGHALRPSLDGRLGITPDVGLAAAVLPDFSHVESDVADVRLNPRFAFRFPERRPLFLDGIDYYEDRPGTLYTRSIHEPLYGAKISGREGPWTVGLLHALDLRPLPSFHERPPPGFTEDDVTGRQAATTVARIRADAFGQGYVGVTLADKRVLGTGRAPGDRGTFDAVALDAEAPLGRRWIVGGSVLQTAWAPSPTDPLRFGAEVGATARRASGIGWGGGVEALWRGDDARLETGFVNQSGLATGRAWVDHTFEPGGVVDTWTPGVAASQLVELEGDAIRDLTASQRLVIGGVHAISASASAIRWREGSVDEDGWAASLGWTGQIGAVVELAPEVSAGRHLDFVHLVPADSVSAGGELALRPTVGLRLDTTARWQRLQPEGLPVAHAVLVRERLAWQFTRTLGLRLIGEWTDGTDRAPLLRSSALLTWLHVPGTALHLGGSETTDLVAGTPVERSIFAKVSVLLRP